MRLSNILMASLLLVPLACDGDDGDSGGDTGQATDPTTGADDGASMTAASMTAASMTADDGVDDGADDGMVTTGTPDPTTGGPADSSSGGPADSSGGESSSGGAASECETFCAGYFEACGADKANDYGDEAGCVTACDGYDAKQFGCKEIHLGNVATMGPAHCAHANIDGGGVC